MKVRELIQKLERMDPDLTVEVEGDDGIGRWELTGVRKVNTYADNHIVELS